MHGRYEASVHRGNPNHKNVHFRPSSEKLKEFHVFPALFYLRVSENKPLATSHLISCQKEKKLKIHLLACRDYSYYFNTLFTHLFQTGICLFSPCIMT